MAGGRDEPSTRGSIFWIIAIATGLAEIAMIVIGTLLAATPRISTLPVYHIALSSVMLNILSFIATIVATILYLIRCTRIALVILCTLFFLLALGATFLTLYTLVGVWEEPSTSQHHDFTTHALAQAGVAVASVTIATQFFFYGAIIRPRRTIPTTYPSHHDDLHAHLATMQVMSGKRSLSIRLTARLSPSSPPPPRYGSAMSEPVSAFSSPSITPRSSFRHSVVNTVLRPVTSRTKLILRPSRSRNSSSLRSSLTYPRSGAGGRGETSLDSIHPHGFGYPHHDDAFETWDTSSVIADSPTLPLTPARTPLPRTRTKLEPIPGSRPVSPAKPLDGPFYHETGNPADLPLPETPARVYDGTSSPLRRSFSSSSSSDSISPPHLHPPPPELSPLYPPNPRYLPSSSTSRPGSAGSTVAGFAAGFPSSRPSTSASSASIQAHIHPLFRTESPVPPPTASPGTVILGSPFAGQIVHTTPGGGTSRPGSRARSLSRSATAAAGAAGTTHGPPSRSSSPFASTVESAAGRARALSRSSSRSPFGLTVSEDSTPGSSPPQVGTSPVASAAVEKNEGGMKTMEG